MSAQPNTLTDRLLIIQAIAAEPRQHPHDHAVLVAALIDGEDDEAVQWILFAMQTNTAFDALAYEVESRTDDLDLPSSGASQDRNTGVWDYTGRYEAAVDRATDDAAKQFLQVVRENIGKDIHEQTPDRLAEQARRHAAFAMQVAA